MSETIVGSVGVQLVPSAKGFSERAKALLSGLTADIAVRLNDTEARAALADLAQTRTATINANADTGEAETQLDAAARNRTSLINVKSQGLSSVSKDAKSASGSMGGILTAALLLGPALVPIAGAFGGIAVVAGIAGVAIVGLEKKQKELDQARAAASKATTKQAYDAAIAQATAIQASISGPQQSFLNAQHSLGAAFQSLIAKVGPSLFGPLTAGLNLVSAILPRLVPLITVVANAFGQLITNLTQQVTGGGFTAFLSYVIAAMPSVISAVDALVGALGHIVIALAPIGGAVLGGLKVLADTISSIPTGVLTSVATGIVAVVAATKAWSIAAGILNLVLDAGPIGLIALAVVGIAAGIAIAAQRSAAFRATLDQLGQTVKANLQPVFDQLKSTFQNQILPTLEKVGPVIGRMVAQAVTFGSAILGKVLPPFIALYGFVFSHLVPILVKIEQIKFDLLVGAIKLVGKAFSGILTVIAKVLSGIANLLGVLGKLPGKFGAPFRAAAAAADGAAAHVRSLASAVDNLHGKTIVIRVVTVQTLVKSAGAAIAGAALGSTASGIATGAIKGTGNTAPILPNFGGGGGGGGGGGSSAPKGPSAAQTAAKAAKAELKKLMSELTSAAKAGGAKLLSALQDIASHITDLPKSVRAPLREMVNDLGQQLKAMTTKLDTAKTALADLWSQFKDLASSITSAFTPQNLFGGSLADLTTGLQTGLQNVLKGLNAEATLIGEGVSQSFVTSLLQSGNGDLAAQVAALDPAQAVQLGAQFDQINTLSGDLGTGTAGDVLGGELGTANNYLKTLVDQNKKLAHDIGVEVGGALNHAASVAAAKNGSHK